MKIAVCQINSTVGGCNRNTENILKHYKTSIGLKVDIVVFPELSIIGYPPLDLLFESEIIDLNILCLNQIATESSVPIIVGYVRKDSNNFLYNSAAVCFDGKIQASYDKVLLPKYDVFDETRYFKSGKNTKVVEIPVENSVRKIGLQICEDLWDDNYDYKVTEEQWKHGAEFFINISSSPFSVGRINERIKAIEQKVKKFNKPFIYCNTVGGQDELIFDGSSLAFNRDGQIIAAARPFIEETIIVDYSKNIKKISLKKYSDEEQLYNALCLGVKDYFLKTGHDDALLGLSGGIDSALVSCIAADALGSSKVHTISLPSKYSSDHSIDDAELLARNLNIDHKVIKINEVVNVMEDTLDPYFNNTKSGIAEENIQARVRGNILMALSNKFNWLLLSTGNKTEMALGYCTLYGDMCGGLSVISDVNKLSVYRLANWINKVSPNRIPQNIISKPPSAELAPGQVDPFDYNIVSPMVDAFVENQSSITDVIKTDADKTLSKFIYNRIKMMEYKRRQSPIGFRVSNKAFGLGRRVPIVNHFEG